MPAVAPALAASTPVRLPGHGLPVVTTLADLTASLHLADRISVATHDRGRTTPPTRTLFGLTLAVDPSATDGALTALTRRTAPPGTLALAWEAPSEVRSVEEAAAGPTRTGWRLTAAGFYGIEIAFAPADDLAAAEALVGYLRDPESALTLAALARPDLIAAVTGAARASSFAAASSRLPVVSRPKVRDILTRAGLIDPADEQLRNPLAGVLSVPVGPKKLPVAVHLAPPTGSRDPGKWMEDAFAALAARRWRPVDLPMPYFARHAAPGYEGRWLTLLTEDQFAEVAAHAEMYAEYRTSYRMPL